jgi:hypothetical protein
MCKHYPIQNFGLNSDCSTCMREKLTRYEGALKKILHRIWELGDYLPREVLETILRIATDALRGSMKEK